MQRDAAEEKNAENDGCSDETEGDLLSLPPALSGCRRSGATPVSRASSEEIVTATRKKKTRGVLPRVCTSVSKLRRFPRYFVFDGTVCRGLRQEYYSFKAATSAGNSNWFGSSFALALNDVN